MFVIETKLIYFTKLYGKAEIIAARSDSEVIRNSVADSIKQSYKFDNYILNSARTPFLSNVFSEVDRR